jgi:Ca2+-binding RTX toxin-like protein
MVVAKAYVSVGMGPGGTSYLPPQFPLRFVSVSPTLVDLLDSQGHLQRYYGSFNLQDLPRGNHSTSVFTGYQQFAGSTTTTALQYEISGAALNGKVVVDYLAAGNVYSLSAVLFSGGDQIDGSAQSDTLFGFAGDDQMRGADGADSLFGDDGNDFVNGNQGSDTLDGGAGADALRGGQGDDVLLGGDGSDQLAGDLGNDFLIGGLAADSLEGGTGNDSLEGGQGDDLLTGGDGNDRLSGDLGNDTLIGSAGNDTLEGGLGSDRFVFSAGLDVIRDFSQSQGDTLAVATASLPFTLVDSAAGLQIISASFGTTTLSGVSSASFNEATAIVFI